MSLYRRHVAERGLAGVHEAEHHRCNRAECSRHPQWSQAALEGFERLEPHEDFEQCRQRQNAQGQVQDEDVETSQEPDELFHGNRWARQR
jgi:hypothetical protein